MPAPITGLHHVTAITADAQKNIDFYTGVLGLRLVKLTVNFDDPGSYHLYYGDELGRPGTIMTFFAWAGAFRGKVGPPQVTATAFAVPAGAMEFWTTRLSEKSVTTQPLATRFGEPVLTFADPDGMPIEIVGSADPKGTPWATGPVSAEHAIRGFHGVTISEEGYENTAKLLIDVMGFTSIGSEQNRFRYQAGSGDRFASIVDLICVPDARHGSMGAGVVHHVAYRAGDDAVQLAWRKKSPARGSTFPP